MSKTTVDAPANIAFIKYWGARDLQRVLPLNTSISMTLSVCCSRCTAQLLPAAATLDEVWLAAADGTLERPPAPFVARVQAQLDRLRDWAGRGERLRIVTRNSFPSAAGMASSASGFAALTLATAGAFGRQPSAEEQSRLARWSGSGSAARSVYGGYVEWNAEPPVEADYATRLAPAGHWDLRDVISVIETGAKAVSSLDGHRRAGTSPYLEKRLALLPERTAKVRQAIAIRDFTLLGETVEEEAVDLHLIAMSSRPPIFYWTPGTLEVLAAIRQLRAAGVAVYATMDAGANVHAICEPAAEDAVAGRLGELAAVHFVLRDRVGTGPRLTTEHLG